MQILLAITAALLSPSVRAAALRTTRGDADRRKLLRVLVPACYVDDTTRCIALNDAVTCYKGKGDPYPNMSSDSPAFNWMSCHDLVQKYAAEYESLEPELHKDGTVPDSEGSFEPAVSENRSEASLAAARLPASDKRDANVSLSGLCFNSAHQLCNIEQTRCYFVEASPRGIPNCPPVDEAREKLAAPADECHDEKPETTVGKICNVKGEDCVGVPLISVPTCLNEDSHLCEQDFSIQGKPWVCEDHIYTGPHEEPSCKDICGAPGASNPGQTESSVSMLDARGFDPDTPPPRCYTKDYINCNENGGDCYDFNPGTNFTSEDFKKNHKPCAFDYGTFTHPPSPRCYTKDYVNCDPKGFNCFDFAPGSNFTSEEWKEHHTPCEFDYGRFSVPSVPARCYTKNYVNCNVEGWNCFDFAPGSDFTSDEWKKNHTPCPELCKTHDGTYCQVGDVKICSSETPVNATMRFGDCKSDELVCNIAPDSGHKLPETPKRFDVHDPNACLNVDTGDVCIKDYENLTLTCKAEEDLTPEERVWDIYHLNSCGKRRSA